MSTANIRRISAGQARLLALAAAVLFSTGGAAIKTGAFSVAMVSCVRSGIAAVALLLWLRGRVSRAPLVLGVGTAYASTLTLFVAATKLTTAASAIFLQSTAPLYILLLGPVVLGERIRLRDAAYIAAAGAGLLLCFAGQSAPTATAPNPLLGNVLGIVCGAAWAATLMGLRRVQREARPGAADPGVSTVVAGNAIACLAALPFAWPLPPAPAGEWLTLGYLGVIQIGLAYVCLSAAMRHLPALEIALLLLLEPVLNPLWTWLVRGEEPGGWALAGGAVIVAATAAKSVYESRTSQASRDDVR